MQQHAQPRCGDIQLGPTRTSSSHVCCACEFACFCLRVCMSVLASVQSANKYSHDAESTGRIKLTSRTHTHRHNATRISRRSNVCEMFLGAMIYFLSTQNSATSFDPLDSSACVYMFMRKFALTPPTVCGRCCLSNESTDPSSIRSS